MDGGLRNRLLWLATGALVFVLLLWHPVTRQAVILLLPLGSGYDDLLGLVALVVGAILLFSWVWTGVPTWFFSRRKDR
ncbi:MAG: hypothetical protein ACOYZ7_08135 [Chloroflexota bacterium]